MAAEELPGVIKDLGQVVGVQKAQSLVNDAAADLGIDASGEFTGEEVIHICTAIEESEGGVVAEIAEEVRSRKETEQRFKQLFSMIPDPALIVSPEAMGIIATDINDAGREVLGVDPGASNTPLDSVLSDVRVEDGEIPISRAIHVGEGTSLNIRVESDDDNEENDRFYICRVSPMVSDDIVAGDAPTSGGMAEQTILLFTDITEQKRQEERLRRLQQITDVLNRVLRHNLRNEMNVVLGLVRKVKNQTDDESVKSDLASVQSRSQDLLDMAKDARDIQDAIQGIEQGSSDAASIGKRYAERFDEEHEAATVEMDIPDEAVVVGDKHLETVLEHVLKNAFEHNDKDEPWVKFVVEKSADEVRIEVLDNGPGIDNQNLDAIAKGSENQLEHGDGLGLWLTSWVVDQYGGEVEFEPRDPVGTRAVITLPTPDE